MIATERDFAIPRCGTFIGDAEPHRANLKRLIEYEDLLNEDGYEIKVLRPARGSVLEGRAAQAWWLAHVLGSPYDYMAYPRLALKCVFGDVWKKAAGLEWANWCTEGCAKAWQLGAHRDVWGKTNPTPKTTGKRLSAGEFVDVTDECIKILHSGLSTFLYFNEDALRPGDIIHVRSPGFWPWMIRKMLDYEYNHDAIVCKMDHRDDI